MDAQVDWQWLRTFGAVARTGSLSAAGAELALHHSTVSRHMASLEEAVCTRLVERLARGIALTSAGEVLLEQVVAMEERAFAGVRAVAGKDVSLRGQVGLTTTDELLPLVLPLLRTFMASYPDIELHIDTASAFRDLSRREADVALRASRTPPDDSIARDMGPIAWGIYGRADADDVWIDGRRGLAPIEPPDGMRVVPTDSVQAAVQAIRGGLGRGPLPSLVGRTDDALHEYALVPFAKPSHLWLLIHPDLRRVARVRVLVEHLEQGLEALRPVLAP